MRFKIGDGTTTVVNLPFAYNGKPSVTFYGAKGDGITDDTAAFKAALTANREIYVPGGTYVLSDTIEIGENCGLELS